MATCRTISALRLVCGILLVVVLQLTLRRIIVDTLSLDVQKDKSSSKLPFWSDDNCIAIHSICRPKNATESPSSLIRDALKLVTPSGRTVQVHNGGGNVQVNGAGINVGTLAAAKRNARQVLSHAIPRTQAFRRDDITLLTHLSTSRLPQLKLQLEWWHGPISAAVVVTNETEVNMLLAFVEANQDILHLTTIHVLVEHNSDPDSYPYNVLRNMAMREAETDYVLAVDVDFVTEGYDRLVGLVRENEEVMQALHTNRLLVLAAFENTAAGAKANAIPRSKADVVKMVEDGLVTPFEIKWWPQGHKPTNFSKYYQNETGVLYDIEYQWNFEPYVLAYRHGLPRYWNDFRSYAYNKCSYFIEAHLMGYKFSVLRDFYVFHMGAAGKPNAGSPPPAEQEKNRKFQEYLSLSYGIPLSRSGVKLVSDQEVLK